MEGRGSKPPASLPCIPGSRTSIQLQNIEHCCAVSPGLIPPPTRLELLPPVPLPPPIFPGSNLRILPRFIEQQVTHRSLQNNTTMYLIHFLEFLLKFFVFIHVSRPTKATRINNCLTNGF